MNFTRSFSVTGYIKQFEEKIQPLIVPAILEHEEIPGISGNRPSGFRSRLSSLKDLGSPGSSQKPTTALLQELTNQHKVNLDITITLNEFCFECDFFRSSHSMVLTLKLFRKYSDKFTTSFVHPVLTIFFYARNSAIGPKVSK